MIDLLILALATHRLLNIWFDQPILRPLVRLLARIPKVGYAATCEFCMSFWLGLVTVLLWNLPYTPYFIWGLAISNLAIISAIGKFILEAHANTLRSRGE